MKSQEEEEILDDGPVSDSSLQKNGEIMIEEVTKGADDQTSQDESLFKLPLDMVEDSWKYKLPLSLFCYGVRHFYPIAKSLQQMHEVNIDIYTVYSCYVSLSAVCFLILLMVFITIGFYTVTIEKD